MLCGSIHSKILFQEEVGLVCPISSYTEVSHSQSREFLVNSVCERLFVINALTLYEAATDK